MNDLIMKNKNEITSLELLDQINFFRYEEGNKNELGHNGLLKVIRDEFEEEIGLGKISQTPYIHPQNKQKYPMFILTLSQAKQVLVRESKFVRKAIITLIEELERNLIPTLQEELKTKNRIIDSLRKNSLDSENVRISKIQMAKNCGTNLLHIPAPWKRAMSITDIDNYVRLVFNPVKKTITIEKA